MKSKITSPVASIATDENLPVYPGGVMDLSHVTRYLSHTVFLAVLWTGAAKLLVSDSSWQKLLEFSSTWEYWDDHLGLFIVCSILVHAVMYYGMNFTFLALHFTGVFQKYQIPRTKGQPFPTVQRLRDTILQGSMSHVTTLPGGAWVLWQLMKYRGATMDGPLPSFTAMCLQFVIAMLFLDFSFYWAHRWFHTPYMYGPSSISMPRLHLCPHLCRHLSGIRTSTRSIMSTNGSVEFGCLSFVQPTNLPQDYRVRR
jgi:hypothetical protein